MDELISIIVPVYNIADYLPRSIESLLQQTYTNLEIIAVDDGSVDGSARVLQELQRKNPRIQIIHQKNGGVSRARFAGIRAARGEWIGFMDGDDYVEADMFSRLMANARTAGADISHCGYQMVFPGRVDYYFNTGRRVVQDHDTGLKDLLGASFVEPGLWNKLYRRKLFRSLLCDGVMDFSIKNTEDLLMNFYLFREAECSVYEDFCPYHYILRKGSAATAAVNEHKLRDPLTVLYRLRQETAGMPALQMAVNQSLASRLIKLACRPVGDREQWIKPMRKQARKKLRGLLPEILWENYSIKIKLEAALAVLCPRVFRTVHSFYSKIRGTRNKYEVK